MLQHLEALKVTLEDVSDEGLRGCSEYVLFPLLLLVDSVAASRLSEGEIRLTRSIGAPEGPKMTT